MEPVNKDEIPDLNDVCFANKDRKHCNCYLDPEGEGLCCQCNKWHPDLCQEGCGQPIDSHDVQIHEELKGHRPRVFDLVAHLTNQQEFSFKTFGPLGEGQGVDGTLNHVEKEIEELRLNPRDKKEWTDLIILGFDGLIKLGCNPEEIVALIMAKQIKNENRQWPDWRTVNKSKAIEHIRTPEEQAQKELELNPKK